MSYNLDKLPSANTLFVSSVADGDSNCSCDSWDSVQSDMWDYISQYNINKIKLLIKNLDKNSERLGFKSTKEGRKIIKFKDNIIRRKLILKLVNDSNNFKLALEIIKYYNKYGFLNDKSQYKFVSIIVLKRMNKFIRRLKLQDVCNIRKDKYCSNKDLLTLAIRVRNYNLRKQINFKRNYSNLKNILSSLNKDYINPYLALDIEEGISIDEVDNAEEALDNIPSCSKVKKHINIRYLENESVLNRGPVYKEISIPIRNTGLLNRLKIIIKRFVNNRKKKEFREEIEMVALEHGVFPSQWSDIPLDKVQPEMMDPEGTIQQQEAGPVVLNALNQDEVSVPTEKSSDNFWIENSTSDGLTGEKHATAMEILCTRFRWSSDDNIGKNLFNIDLPIGALVDNNAHPACMYFKQYAYWHGDIRVRIHINTTPFHVGKLIFSWYYSQKFDDNAFVRDNIASSVLLPYVSYNASEGGDVLFNIPYKNYRSMLPTRPKLSDSLHLYLGTLRCHVFNPLVTNDHTIVDGYVHVSFVNSQFTGIMPMFDIQPEMLPMRKLVKSVEKSLTLVDSIVNMDKPPIVAPPAMYTPQFTDSFATGTNDVNNIHPLRLDPCGQTQHPSGSSTNIQETNIKSIISQWGFLRTVIWKNDKNAESKLFTLPVSPELEFGQYFSTTYSKNNKSIRAAVMPPVSVISSINAFNRGSIEYKFEIINSKYHTGALLASFTPILSRVTYTEAVQSYNITMDVGNVSEYVFKVPYINERPYNPRFNREISNNVNPLIAPIGELNLYVVNELRNVAGTTDHVYINIYMRAGNDFEVAVPVSPLYSIDMDVFPSGQVEYVEPAELTLHLGMATWRYFDSIQPKALIGKYGVGDDNIIQFPTAQFYTVYEAEYLNQRQVKKLFNVSYFNDKGELSSTEKATFKYMALFIVNGDKNKYRYGIFFNDPDVAKLYVRAHYLKDNGKFGDSPTIAEWIRHGRVTQNIYYLGDQDAYAEWDGQTADFRYKYFYQYPPRAQNDEVRSDPTISTLQSTNDGLRMFGEQFVDLKDYCRRYQPYSGFVVNGIANTVGHIVRVPVTPIGLDISDTGNSKLLNIIGEGMIPFVCSAFRFYRGGLRFKIMVQNFAGTDDKMENLTLFIQHKPDVISDTRKITSTTVTKSTALFQTGYAYTALSTVVNNSLTLEVPCYVPSNLLMLQKPNYSKKSEVMHYSLGCMDIYVDQPISSFKSYINIHYSFADDMDLSTYIGFPPVVPIAQNVDSSFVMVQPEMDDEKPTCSKNVVKIEDKQPTAEGMFDTVKQKVKSVLKRSVIETVREDLNLPVTEDANSTIWSIINDMVKKYGSEHKHVIVSCISQIVHCINSPILTTFVIGVVTFLSHLGLNLHHKIVEMTKWFGTLFSNKIQSEGDDKTEISPVEVAKSSIISSIVEASLLTFGKTKDFIANLSMPNFMSSTFTNVRMGAITINAIVNMFNNLFTVVPKIFSWLGKMINPMQWYRWLFFNENKFIVNWLKDVEFVVDPNNRTTICSQVRYNYHMQLLVMAGRDICSKGLHIKDKVNFKYIYDMNNKLNSVYNDVTSANMASGNIGIEPFCFCIQGNSQVGKTYITKEVAAACLKAINYQTYDNLFYTRGSGLKYWDGVNNEPVCIFDDFCQIKTEQALSESLQELISIKSKATFMPNRAHLQDKGRKYSPLIVALTMNESHPNFSGIVAEPVAWQNRRDVLIKTIFVPNPEYPNATRVQDLPREVAQQFKHCKFNVYKHVATGANIKLDEMIRVRVPQVDQDGKILLMDDTITLIDTLDMNIEQLKWYLSDIFQVKYQNMKSEYLRDLEQAKAFYPAPEKDFEVNLQNYAKYLEQIRIEKNSFERDVIKRIEKYSNKLNCEKCNSSIDCTCDLAMFSTKNIGCLSVQAQIGDSENVKVQEVYNKLVVDLPPLENKINAKTINIESLDKKFNAVEFKFMLESHKHQIVEDLKYSTKLRLVKLDIARFIAYPCPHTLLLYLGAKATHYDAYQIDDKWYLIYDANEYSMSPEECDICKKAFINNDLMDKYKQIYKTLLLDNFVNVKDMPLFVEASPDKVCRVTTRYMQQIEEAKLKFNDEINKVIEKKSWLGSIGSMLCSIIRPLFSITCLVASFMAIKLTADLAIDAYDRYVIRKRNMKKMLELKAEVLANHIPDDNCMASNCDICKMNIPQMAYDQHRMPRNIKKHVVQPKTQAEMAQDMRASIDRKLRRNYFFLVAITSYDVEVVSRCLGIRSHAFLAIDHYIDKIKSLPLDTKLEIRTSQYVRGIQMADLCFNKLKNSSLLIGMLPRTFPQFVDIVPLFASASMIPNITKDASLYVCDIPTRVNKIENYNVTWFSNKIKLHDDTLSVPHIVDEQLPGTIVDYYWSYETSGKGLCGSILISNMNINNPLVGIHIAGMISGGRGYSEVIVNDTLIQVLDDLKTPIQDTKIEGQMLGDKFIPLCDNPKSVKSALEGNYMFLGTVPPKFAYNPPKDSKCIHSLCYNEITTSTYDVPHLSQNDIRFEGSPMVKGCTYHTDPPKEFENDIFDVVIDDVNNLILSKVIPCRQLIGPLTISEAVCGIPSIPNYDAMEFDTSEGFPFSSIRPSGAKDKKWLFDLTQDENGYILNGINPLLEQTMKEKHELRCKGVIPLTIFTDCLKDLKLPKEKCHKTRIFSISPVDFTIQFRQYFYDFTIAFQRCMLNIESAVGINVDSYEWHDMVQKLLENSTKFVCGDYSKFGPRLMTKCVLAAFDIMINWYVYYGDNSLENKQVRQVMAYETAHARHLMLNMVYEVMCGAPSGCPITTILNNCVNMIYIRVAYLYLIRNYSTINVKDNITVNTLSSFYNNISIFFYGDDLIMTVKDNILSFFNASNLSMFFKKYDIVFTDALKTGNVKLSTSVFDQETSFLKRNIKRHELRPVYVAAMDRRAIEETCNWVFKGHDEPEASIIACESMLLNAFGHGETYYMDLRNKVLIWWRKNGEYPRIPTWKEVDWRIFEGIKDY